MHGGVAGEDRPFRRGGTLRQAGRRPMARRGRVCLGDWGWAFERPGPGFFDIVGLSMGALRTHCTVLLSVGLRLAPKQG